MKLWDTTSKLWHEKVIIMTKKKKSKLDWQLTDKSCLKSQLLDAKYKINKIKQLWFQIEIKKRIKAIC